MILPNTCPTKNQIGILTNYLKLGIIEICITYKSRRVIIQLRFGISKRFQYDIRLQYLVLCQMKFSGMSCYCSKVLQRQFHGLGFSRARFSTKKQALVSIHIPQRSPSAISHSISEKEEKDDERLNVTKKKLHIFEFEYVSPFFCLHSSSKDE